MHIVMNSASNSSGDQILVGINFLEDTNLNHEGNTVQPLGSRAFNGVLIGYISISSLELSAHSIRHEILNQIGLDLPNFCFLTKQGWPVALSQERNLRVKNLIQGEVIRIKRHFDFPRVGVKKSSGDILGFIFVDLSCTVKEVRNIVNSEVLNKSGENFCFLDKNNWQLRSHQEDDLTGWDIINQGYFIIKTEIVDNKSCPSSSHEISTDMSKKKRKLNRLNSSLEDKRIVKSNNLHPMDAESKAVVISYVHKEALHHAAVLKKEIENHGLTVFLDIEDISGGQDWADALNTAVSNCRIFVPLVTHQYGETKWTNREVKLADQKGKQIIPVNFLDSWPPDCLAIQFSSLQYIQWKANFISDISEEPVNGILNVACEVAGKIIDYSSKLEQEEISTHTDSLSKFKSYKHLISQQSEGFSPVPADGLIKIVISVHQKQNDYAHELCMKLSEHDFDVWCSTDYLDPEEVSEDTCSTNEFSLTPSTPSKESDSFPFKYPNSSFESAPQQSSLDFEYSAEPGMSSQNSGCSQNTPLSEVTNKLNIFKHRTKAAKLVIIILSKDYSESKSCKQQAFYCEQRKRVLVIKYDDFSLPCVMKKILPDDMFQSGKENFDELLKTVKTIISEPSPEIKKILKNDTVSIPVKCRLKEAIKGSFCIYITGSTCHNGATLNSVCHALGLVLAHLRYVTLITSGYFGVSEDVARIFCEERDILKEKPAKVFHIIPFRDLCDFSEVSKQNEDGTFEKLPFGQTHFLGNSVKERSATVAQLCDACIFIDGAVRAAEDVQEFVWNDKVVIPVKLQENAIADESIMQRILQVPCGVDQKDWQLLNNNGKSKQNENILAKAVKRIIQSLWKCQKKKNCEDISEKSLKKGCKRKL